MKFFATLFSALSLSLILSGTALASPLPITTTNFVTVSEACPEGLETEASVLAAISKAGFEILATKNVSGEAFPLFMAAVTRLTAPPAGTDNFNIYLIDNGNRVVINARNGVCSLGVIVIPSELFANLMAGAVGDPA